MEMTGRNKLEERVSRMSFYSQYWIRKITCVLLGHSKICGLSNGGGYRYCGRCGEFLVDNLGSIGPDNLGSIDPGIKEAVIMGQHNRNCIENYKKCTWGDKLFVQYPFFKGTEEKQ